MQSRVEVPWPNLMIILQGWGLDDTTGTNKHSSFPEPYVERGQIYSAKLGTIQNISSAPAPLMSEDKLECNGV